MSNATPPEFAPSAAGGALILLDDFTDFARAVDYQNVGIGTTSFRVLTRCEGARRVLVPNINEYQRPADGESEALPLVVAETRAAQVYAGKEYFGRRSGVGIDRASLGETLALWLKSERPQHAAPKGIGKAVLSFAANYCNHTPVFDRPEDDLPVLVSGWRQPADAIPTPVDAPTAAPRWRVVTPPAGRADDL